MCEREEVKMSILKSNHLTAMQFEAGLKEKTYGLGEETVSHATETNIVGVTLNSSVCDGCLSALKEYKLQLDTDLSRISKIGITFFEIDHEGISF